MNKAGRLSGLMVVGCAHLNPCPSMLSHLPEIDPNDLLPSI